MTPWRAKKAAPLGSPALCSGSAVQLRRQFRGQFLARVVEMEEQLRRFPVAFFEILERSLKSFLMWMIEWQWNNYLFIKKIDPWQREENDAASLRTLCTRITMKSGMIAHWLPTLKRNSPTSTLPINTVEVNKNPLFCCISNCVWPMHKPKLLCNSSINCETRS